MKLRSAISLELAKAGYLRGSKEWKAAYQRLRRKVDPSVRQKEGAAYRKWAASKGKKYHARRLQLWRDRNPEKWKALMNRASKNGLHRRFYERHCERIKQEKSAAGKRERQKHPTFGLRNAIAKAGRCEISIAELVGLCESAIAKTNERSNKSGDKSKDSKRGG